MLDTFLRVTRNNRELPELTRNLWCEKRARLERALVCTIVVRRHVDVLLVHFGQLSDAIRGSIYTDPIKVAIIDLQASQPMSATIVNSKSPYYS